MKASISTPPTFIAMPLNARRQPEAEQ
jgi:hypothetical protein